MEWLKGKKTYAVGVALLCYIAVQYLTEQPVATEWIYAAFGAMGLTIRHGVANGKGPSG